MIRTVVYGLGVIVDCGNSSESDSGETGIILAGTFLPLIGTNSTNVTNSSNATTGPTRTTFSTTTTLSSLPINASTKTTAATTQSG